MRILVVGGTRFLGRAIVNAALGHGHQVTLFNRGQTNPELFPGLPVVHGDRVHDARLLAGRTFDATIDVAGMGPDDVRPIAQVVSDSTERHVFISTVSVYADHSVPQVEGQAVLSTQDDPNPAAAYGTGKAEAERLVGEIFGDRALVVRPGLIVGPHDPTDRFAYWPRRVARGGRVLAPGGAGHSAQFIDVRDLAAWIVTATEQGLGGTYNAAGHPTTLGEVLARCQQVITGATSSLVWVDDHALVSAGVAPWMGIPLWILPGLRGWEAANEAGIDKALRAGLRFRPLEETIVDTLAWDLARGGPAPGREGLSAEREEELLSSLIDT
jgi:2'-hydroxyisoflavone reductase